MARISNIPISIRVDLVSDIVCPWCIIGYKQFEAAQTELGDSIRIDLHFHPFELNPNMSSDGENLRAHLAAKYGTTPEGSVAARKRLTDLGAEHGFKFDYHDHMKMYNTFKAHQVLHFARSHMKETELKLRLFSAYFGERKDINDTNVLVAEAETVGLDDEAVRKHIQNSTFADAVRQEEQTWQSNGVSAVPAFIFNQQYLVSGAHPKETFMEILQHLRDTAPSQKVI